uniref:Glycoside hydrolase family 31 TIM barrel domain-containing protein n=1 Tax=Sinocyclocheilus anshuiensis TaxID=1608454 RepID=A0A671SNJ1_9TELE
MAHIPYKLPACFAKSSYVSLQKKFLERGCCWSRLSETNVPCCFFSKNHGYNIEAKLTRMEAPSLFGADIKELTFSAEMQTENHLRFKICLQTDTNTRFEVQTCFMTFTHKLNCAKTYSLHHLFLSCSVRFETTIGPLSAKLPSHNIHGLGEHVHQTFRYDTNWRTWPIFTRDDFPNGVEITNLNVFSYRRAHTTCTAIGQSFGVFLMNSNAMVQPAPAVTFRTISGVLDFYILVGETPETVMDEFTKLIGRPFIPPYWSLGFQLSRWDYGSLEEVKEVVERNRQAGLPYDVQYTDIDYMENKNIFTWQKYIVILDPAVSTGQKINGPYEALERGHAAKAWVTEPDGETPLLGEVWPGETVFPDYTNQACIDWWVDEISRFHKEVKHDALWIDMNEVANFVKGGINGCTDNKLNYPPFTPSESQMHLQLDYMGTLYPLSRNHKAQGYHTYGFDSLVVNTSRHYLNIRYTLFPYLYTLFYKAHVKGETVVCPITDRKATINMYLPEDTIGLHMRGRGMLPLYVCVMKVVCSLSRCHPMGLIVALDDNKAASGELFWDDGDSRGILEGLGVLSMQVAHNGYQDPNNLKFESITVLGVTAAPALVAVSDGNTVISLSDSQIQYDIYKWDSAVPGYTFSDQFLQISTRLPSEYVYGFGETEHPTYKHSLNFHKYGLFYKLNSYGVHPFYMGLEKSKNAHGVLLLNSNAMDVTFQPTPMIGHPVLPAYWSLGFQLCRYVYSNDTEIADLYRNMKAAQIPYDVQYADIYYMERQMDFSEVNFKGLPSLVDQMRAEGMRFIFILDPAIAGNETKGSYPAFDTGIEKDVFIKWPPELSNNIVGTYIDSESMPHSFVDSIFCSALRHEFEVLHVLQYLELCL